jgi:D-alanyl-D-alanine carboxypeptidase
MAPRRHGERGVSWLFVLVLPFKSMRTLTIALLLFTSAVVCRAQDFLARADAYLSKYTEQGQFMGSVMVARNGKILFEKAYGLANVELDLKNTVQSKFNLASVTKQFTGMAVLQLAERGTLKLDDPISKYYKDAPIAWERITIYHLLSHTSGIPNPKSLSDYPKGVTQPYTPEELIAVFRNKPLDFPPGTKFKYSNPGYYLLGYLIEKASGQTYADYLREHIFAPLGMHNSGYETNTAILKGRASGYTVDQGTLQNADYVDWSVPFAAGALYSTVEDLLKWDRALYTEKLLGRAWRERLFTPDQSGYNYGWFIRDKGGRQKIYHEGGNPGYTAFISRYPADQTCIIVLSNLEVAPVGKIADDLIEMLYGEESRRQEKK